MDKDVAVLLGMNQHNLSSRKSAGGPIPYERLVKYTRDRHVSLEFVINGRGPMRTVDMMQEPGAVYRIDTNADTIYDVAGKVYQALTELGATMPADKFNRTVRLIHRGMLDRRETTVPYEQILEIVKLAL